MSIELEAKLKVDDLDAVRRRLREVGAERCGAVVETNTIFDDRDRSLLAADAGLRVRGIRPLDGAGPPATVTYKGPRQPGALKRRTEIEVTVGDPDAMAALLESVGMIRVLRFQKRRESWRLGGCCVELDEVPRLGRFVEIEGPDDATIQAVRDRLGLADCSLIPDSYVALLVVDQPTPTPAGLEYLLESG